MTTARNVSLTEPLNRFIDRQVERGRHQNASEVVREALRRYESELAEDDARVEALRVIAAEGRQAIERGDYVTLSSEDDIARLMRDLDEEAKQRAAEIRGTVRGG